jgi:hypothetical protein
MTDFPLTPAEAIAAAALITTHAAEKAGLPAVADLVPRWKGWAERLRTWGEANLASDIGLNDIHADVTPVAETPPVDLVAALARATGALR